MNPRTLIRTGLGLAFPLACTLCGTVLPPAAEVPLCRDCRPAAAADDRRCGICSLPLLSERAVCMRCRTREFPFLSNHSIFLYRGDVRELVHRYKFGGERLLARFFAEAAAEVIPPESGPLPVVPVPCRPAGKRRRGFDPAEEILRHLARMRNLRILPLLFRQGGASQKSLDFTGRLDNLKGRIRYRGGNPPPSLLLFDDVFTTGATAAECTRVLAARGATEIRVLTIAID